MNLIKQIVRDGEYGTQTVKIVVRSNERGAQGEQGPRGEAATIQAGNAYSIPGNQQPAVINTGSSSEAVFDFYIPHGQVDWGDIVGDITAQRDLNDYLDKVDTAVQPDDLDYDLVQDLSINSNGSTSVVQLDADKINLKTKDTTTKNIPLPVASSTKAGVMNSATFDAVQDNSNAINMILGGMVAVTGLSSSPTQSELTTAWEEASGLDAPSNYAKILDVDNNKYWTYYTNLSTWFPSSADIQVSVSTFTNSTLGLIMGSTTDGQIYAESNGTGSVNGWDALSATVADNAANKLATNNLTVDSTLNRTVTGSGASSEVQLGLADGSVTPAKFASYAVNKSVYTSKNLSPTADTTAAWKVLFPDNGVYWTWYDVAGKFANQPQQYGCLETVRYSNEVYQRWHNQAGGVEMYRSGNGAGWNGSASSSGVFKKVYDSSQAQTALYVSNIGTTNSVGSTKKALTPTYTIPSDGLYYISAHVSSGASNTKHILVATMNTGSVECDARTAESVTNYAGNNFARASLATVAYCTQGTVVKCYATVENTTTTVSTRIRVKKMF